jgi:hypothetical protein
VAVAVGPVLVPPPAHADTAGPTLSIPAPTGPHQVGATTVELEGTSRADPWVPSEPARDLT